MKSDNFADFYKSYLSIRGHHRTIRSSPSSVVELANNRRSVEASEEHTQPQKNESLYLACETWDANALT
jgi:hypothetical protein